MAPRIDDYEGSENEYTAYLEECVRQCRRQHSNGHSIDFYQSRQRSVSKRGIEFVEVTFPEPVKKPYQRQADLSRPIQTPKWISVAEELVGETPSAAEWTDKLRELEISSTDALSFLLSSSQTAIETADPNPILTSISVTRGLSLIDRITALACAAAQHRTRAVSALRLGNLAQFIILSTCQVLLDEQEGERGDVFRIVRICVGKDVTERYVMDLLRTVRFINQSIDVFDAHGWTNRGSQLLLICKVQDVSSSEG